MSTVQVRRGPRAEGPRLPEGEIPLEPPPVVPRPARDTAGGTLIFLGALLAAAALLLVVVADSGTDGWNGWRTGVIVLLAVSVTTNLLGQLRRPAREHRVLLGALQHDYLRYLDQMDRLLRRDTAQQRSHALWAHPAPDTLWAVAMTGRLWERRPSDGDFAQVRIGIGPQSPVRPLIAPETPPLDELEQVSAQALRELLHRHAVLPDLPVALALRSFARVVADGDRDAVRGLTRAAVAQLCTLQSPQDLRISVCTSSATAPHWEWVKWLPHAQHPTERDALGALRLMSHGLDEVERLLAEDLRYRPAFNRSQGGRDFTHHVIVLDDGRVPPDTLLADQALHGVTLIDVGGAVLPPVDDAYVVHMDVTQNELRVSAPGVGVYEARPDRLSIREAEALARQLAPLRPDRPGWDAVERTPSLRALLGITDPHRIDVSGLRQGRGARARLRVPLGAGADGLPVSVDLKESAAGGYGPHGLMVGATGSGKTELLRTMVLGLALTHTPQDLALVLVDFKGQSTFAGLRELPHVAGLATSVEQSADGADRLTEGLRGELQRRQQMLRRAKAPNQEAYQRARALGAPLEPLPALLLVIDEFSELVRMCPDMVDALIAVGRVGRSLGVHMLLASQRLEEGRLRGLDSYLSYRIALRTFSSQESRAVIGVPDAYELAPVPGHGLLKVGADALVPFRAAYVSGGVNAATPAASSRFASAPDVALFAGDPVLPEAVDEQPPAAAPDEPAPIESFLDVAVRQMAAPPSDPARPVLLPRLTEPRALGALLPPLEATPEAGLTAVGSELRGQLCAVLGEEDRPHEQRQVPHRMRLSGAGANAALVGAPGSGLTALLHNLVLSLSLLHTPAQVTFHCIDGESGLGGLAGLPHVGTVASPHDSDLLPRIVSDLEALITARQRSVPASDDESVGDSRWSRDGQEGPHAGAHVFLVVHGWGTLRAQRPTVARSVVQLAARGPAAGVHVVVTARSWSEVGSELSGLLGSRAELRLGDPADSAIDRRRAERLTTDVPGHGLTGEGTYFLAALPQSGEQAGPQATEDLVSAVAAAWHGPVARPVQPLPRHVTERDLPPPGAGARLPFGLDCETLAPVMLDFASAPHLVVMGEAGCGKSNLLRLIASGLAERILPGQAEIICIAPHGSLFPPSDEAARSIITLATCAAAAARLRAVADRPGQDGTSRTDTALTYLIVDDYDVVRSYAPLMASLRDLFGGTSARDLHMVAALGLPGAAAAAEDPVLRAAARSGSPGLLMSGDPGAGPLFGAVRPRRLPVGRGLLVSPGSPSPRIVQTAHLTPRAPVPGPRSFTPDSEESAT
ncbi:type VII secretion protein EccCa [Streptomyces coeruleorubidus]|uniref:type VII secretion protein EccCa n=1 Tax=Streptomyces coeruleorubidus TaxID=116188 RepID=UPI0036B69846